MLSHDLDEKSYKQRKLILEILEKSRRGHIGSAFSVLEIIRVMYDSILHYDAKHPESPSRDIFVMSKGHGCLALYVVLAEKGFFPAEELFKFCAEDGILGGHPERETVPGVEVSTGSLGHGLSVASGMALGLKMDGRRQRVFALVGDGECNEGTVWEAALFCAKHRLDNLTVLVDYNKMQCYGTTSDVTDLEPLADKWISFGFEVREVNGHDVKALEQVLSSLPFRQWKPSALICHTVKGKGIPLIENNPNWHHKAKITDAEIRSLRYNLGEEPGAAT